MCSEFKIKASAQDIRDALGTSIKNVSENETWDKRIKMTLKAPVLALKDDEIRLNELVFPVNPFPNARLSQIESNKKKDPVAASDDQIVRIYDVPLWKAGFEKFPCLVPMSSFYEPAYWGPHRGEVVEFKAPGEDLLFVPAILVKPRVPATGLLNGFSLLTHTASDQMLGFHHRLLVQLKPKSALEYLRLGKVTPEERFEFLLEHRHIPQFETTVDRRMARGWDKRVESHEASLGDEQNYRDTLKREGVVG